MTASRCGDLHYPRSHKSRLDGTPTVRERSWRLKVSLSLAVVGFSNSSASIELIALLGEKGASDSPMFWVDLLIALAVIDRKGVELQSFFAERAVGRQVRF